jgi:subtilisin family serine protease
VIAGIDWVAKKHQNKGDGALSVANLSLGGFFSLATNQAVEALADAGVVVAVAAGNDNSFACLASPASALGVITVGSSTRDDERSSFSNFGLWQVMVLVGALFFATLVVKKKPEMQLTHALFYFH